LNERAAEKVWNQVVAFAEIPPPKEFLFGLGSRTDSGERFRARVLARCALCFFNGPFVEPIEVWDEPQLLRFGVTANPAPLNEPVVRNIQPPHCHGFFTFVSEKGQFR